MATLTPGKVLKYTLLPGFWPRLRDFFSSGFNHIAYTMALVYASVRLLPPDHPYLDPANFGRYRVRHVMAEAANRLVFKWQNFDQILIFFTILIGLILLIAQFVLVVIAIIHQQPVYAGVAGPLSEPVAGPAQDLAFIILDRVFGLRGFYDSCISTAANCLDLSGRPAQDPSGAYPFPFHIALHTLLRFYSLGIFMVSVIVILYFVTTIVGETATTGSPFGQRFNNTWAPVRLILFFALLLPLNIGGRNEGLNGAQLLTFYSAKLGSNFATNAWDRFNNVLTTSYLGEPELLVAAPTPPPLNSLVRFMFLAMTCKITEEYAYEHPPDGVQAYLVRDRRSDASMAGDDFLNFQTTDYQTAVEFSNQGTIEIRFGVYNPEQYKLEKGNVSPYCGILRLQTVSLDEDGELGSYLMQEIYYNMIKEMWARNPRMVENAQCVRDRVMQLNHDPNCPTWPTYNFAQNEVQVWNDYIRVRIPEVVAAQIEHGEWGVTPRLRAAGWAGAAIWYNRIAQVNGDITASILNIPQGFKFPYVMEAVAQQNSQGNENLNPDDLYDPALGGDREADYPRYRDRSVAMVLYNAYTFWDKTGLDNPSDFKGSGFIDAVNLIFGTSGLYSMRENADIHPLAQLSSLGKGMVDAAIRNIVVGTVAGGASELLANLAGIGSLGKIGSAAGDFLATVGKTTILMGFILYYVLPFLPFIYFMFAVSGWVKSIFEAIVAMPLWALSHISRLDGEGIAGPGATNGYFLILEIFLRPVLILFGLIASLSIFAASVSVLNDVFDLVISNAGGFDRTTNTSAPGLTEIAFYRGPIDEFFFSAIYAIICYMMALGFFKMIDQVPNNILRWLGVSVSTFSEQAGDPAGTLTSKIYQGGSLALGQVKSGGQLAALFGGGAPGPSDPRLKEEIVHIGQENGHNIYSFRYKGQDKTYIGVMADEVLRTHPQAVTMVDGYLAVYYDRIGVRFREAET